MKDAASSDRASKSGAGERLTSLDALRGFTMFWIIGGDSIGHALGEMHHEGLLGWIAKQLDHVEWEGFHFYDLIFPTFVFIVGISIVFSLTKILTAKSKFPAIRRILKRTFLLYLFGVLYYGGWAKGFDEIRWLGVLQRIALCYGATSLLFLWFRPRGLAIWCAGLLLGYWALMTFVPVPDMGAGDFAEGRNLTNWIDAQYLPGFKWDGDHDPEGLLSTLPAIGTCLLGVFAGLLMQRQQTAPWRKIVWLAGAGAGCLVLGYLWGFQFPVIKKIWTSSYVLVAGGCSALFFAAFYGVIDVAGWRFWARPFVWIGMNPITIYLLSKLIDFDQVSSWILGGPVEDFFNQRIAQGLGEVIISFGGMCLAVLVCWWLHRRKIFLRV